MCISLNIATQTLLFASLILQTIVGQVDNNSYFGVAFSPYVKSDGSWWNAYSLQDVKRMLTIVIPKHKSISSYSMGVTQWNVKAPWDEGDSNCFISRAAAQLNQEYNSTVLTVSQGIYQQSFEDRQHKEIEGAFGAAQDANKIWSNTVWGITFTNEYIINLKTGQQVLKMIQENWDRAHNLGLKVGPRIHICHDINNGRNMDILIEIAKISDFIMCNMYPAESSNNAKAAVRRMGINYYKVRDSFLKHNKNLEIIIGETGWASEGDTFFNKKNFNTVKYMKEFWEGMRVWAIKHRVRVFMFEAFDEPWKVGMQGEKHFGWWKRVPNNTDYYIEKSTGKIL